jgi:hypothetical protein
MLNITVSVYTSMPTPRPHYLLFFALLAQSTPAISADWRMFALSQGSAHFIDLDSIKPTEAGLIESQSQESFHDGHAVRRQLLANCASLTLAQKSLLHLYADGRIQQEQHTQAPSFQSPTPNSPFAALLPLICAKNPESQLTPSLQGKPPEKPSCEFYKYGC